MKDLLQNNNLLNNQNYVISKKELDYVIKEFPYKIDYYERTHYQYMERIIFIKILFIAIFTFFVMPYIAKKIVPLYIDDIILGLISIPLYIYLIYILLIYKFGSKERGYEKRRKERYIFLKIFINDNKNKFNNFLFVER